MAFLLLPTAGHTLVPRKEEFAFNTIREVQNTRCTGYDCDNIPQNIFDYKYTDYSKEAPCHHEIQQQEPPQLQHQQMQHQQMQHQQMQHQQIPHQQLQYQQQPMPNKWPFPNGTGEAPSQRREKTSGCKWCNYKQPQQQSGLMQATHAPSLQQGGLMPGDQKRPTIPMSNCQPLCCRGRGCSCLAPEDALWGKTPFDVSTCWWKQGRETSQMRVRDPQVVRPHDKSLPEQTRPTVHPYFTHGAKTCPPHEAPIAQGSGFNFEQWLATRNDREPSEHLKNQCISSLCHMCGPITLECCPGYEIPQNYMLAKRV